MQLQPRDFDITGQDYTPEEIVKKVETVLKNDKTLDLATKNYCLFLLHYYSGDEIQNSTNISIIPTKNTQMILKNYMEIIGALAIIRRSALKKIKISKNSKINFPSAQNEPFVDYFIIDGKKKYSISAKSGKTTNTLKPADIIKVIESNKTIFDKWKDTLEYKILTCLFKGSIVGGACLAVGQLLHSKVIRPTDKMNMTILKENFEIVQKYGDSQIKNKNPRFVIEMENIIVGWSRTANYKDLFLDVLMESSLIYLKSDKILNDGTIMFSSLGEDIKSDAEKLKIISFRSKNSASFDSKGNARISDKLGLQM